jgi:mono/diheme cytochrome c family protein
MKKMHWSGIIATGLISMSAMAGCSGDDAPAVNGTAGMSSGGSGTAGSGTAGSGTAGSGTAGSGTGGTGSNVGVQLTGPAAFTILTDAEAPEGTAAPAGYATCLACHRPKGEGFDQLAPEIRHTPADFLKGVVRAGRLDHTGAMTGMGAYTTAQVSDADLDAIAAWTLSLPKPTTPEGLYHSMCGNCHGPKTPTGGGSPISIQGVSKDKLKMLVRNGNGTNVNDRKEYMPKYDTTLLTDQELDLIGTFIGAK